MVDRWFTDSCRDCWVALLEVRPYEREAGEGEGMWSLLEGRLSAAAAPPPRAASLHRRKPAASFFFSSFSPLFGPPAGMSREGNVYKSHECEKARWRKGSFLYKITTPSQKSVNQRFSFRRKGIWILTFCLLSIFSHYKIAAVTTWIEKVKLWLYERLLSVCELPFITNKRVSLTFVISRIISIVCFFLKLLKQQQFPPKNNKRNMCNSAIAFGSGPPNKNKPHCIIILHQRDRFVVPHKPQI